MVPEKFKDSLDMNCGPLSERIVDGHPDTANNLQYDVITVWEDILGQEHGKRKREYSSTRTKRHSSRKK